ncbi:alkane 1-monooxygenase [Tenacibaculum lutimaris]|uniref:Alkane 1-monooxygenase n=1 Tax=Tenacibaculum lutimaris TaxID=285258 RepID=A0A420E3T3_9FLAO|nr:alkane 1-monooxygenase [Tenacibaculum lutimaris]RKF04758.1 alkane 1-monooxygenase [Tenacibaculum lutimaris]
MKALKFLAILILPVTVYISFTNTGWLTLLPLFIFFGLVPLLELLFNPDKQNLSKEQEEREKENKLYTYILYITVPVQLIFLGWFLWMMKDSQLTTLEYIGRVSAMGLMCGVIGINVGHELGHRSNRFEQFLGEILLLTSLDTHFLPYHNAGHHFNVATPKDAATARKNEIVYLFWIRSHFQSYYQAWEAQNKRLKNSDRNWFHLQNRMVIYTICNILLLAGIFFFFGLNALLSFTAAAVFGILLLETVNYIEHYGLLRKQNEKGRYERVKRTHSWNSDHRIGMLMLFNLSRHSDHHYNGSKHYQLLKSLPESPQMPTGYPGMMLVALVPPLWFSIMNKKLQDI